MNIIDENTIKFKRLMFSKMYKLMWCYTLEEIILKLDS
jgi:hypothetical protein